MTDPKSHVVHHPRINALIAFGGGFELSVWMDSESCLVRALLVPFAEGSELKRRLRSGSPDSGAHYNPLVDALHKTMWLPLGIGSTLDDALELLSRRLNQLPSDEVNPDDDSMRTKWMRSVDRVCQDMNILQEKSDADLAVACKIYPLDWVRLHADRFFA
jgi:hypothetical protein